MSKTPVFVKPVFVTLVIGLLMFNISPATADWYVAQNPVSGNPEAVWSTPKDETSSNILYSYLDGSSWAPSITLSVQGELPTAPVLAFAGDGARTIVWQTSSDQIVLRAQSYGSSTWSSEVAVSESSETAAIPFVALYDGSTHVSYETSPGGGNRSVKVARLDPGGNVERTVVASTSSLLSLLTELHTESDHLWLEWLDSSSSMGYSAYIDGAWTSPSYEAYSGPDDIKDARERVREHVLSGE